MFSDAASSRPFVAIALGLVFSACSEHLTTPDTGLNQVQRGYQSPVDVPAVQVDLPPSPRPYDTDDSALVAALRAQGGYAVIGFKLPGSPRTLEASGYRAAIPSAAIDEGLGLVRAQGVEIEYVYRSFGAVLGRIDPATAPDLRRNPLVDFIEPRHVMDPQGNGSYAAPPSRESAPSLLASAAQTTPWGISMVRAPEAWSVNTGTAVKIGVIGEIVEGHEDLPYVPCSNVGGRYASDCGTIFVGPQIPATFLAGIGFARNNTLGVVGVAPGLPGSNLYVWAACSYQFVCYSDDITAGIDALRWAGARVIQVGRFRLEYDLAEAVAVSQAWSAGIVVVAPAGINGGSAVTYPAALSTVLGVSGVLRDKTFASSSPCVNSDGTSMRSNYGSHVDLAAPFFALSTVGQNAYQDERQGWCGTHIASAHVLGAAALVRSQNPSWTNQQVVDRLLATAQDRGTGGRDDFFGYGIVDAAYALGIAPPPPPPPPLSGVSISGPTSVRPYDTCLWTAAPTGGTAPFTYSWYVNNLDLGVNSNEVTYTAGSVSFTLAVQVADATGVTVTSSRTVSISSSANICAI
jgi:hypothetical protein